MYRGKVDEWRFFRNGFNLVHLSLVEKGADIREYIPLPFDEDYGKSDDIDMIAEYNKLKESGALDE